ncbi:transcriptional regulator [Serratia sp. NPDC078593]|uniref:winged helix-turn-helix domain-containing protein n=1 Tax=unclassified Serratia (in: enterobacteria) TaxID=2647522 RepID=UPI0037CF8875
MDMKQMDENCYYVIADKIEFRPEENLLYSRITGEKITLYVAASRCLQMLLREQGSVVAQQQLFDIGWEKNGMGVSKNTFYQNILTLRKGLKIAGYDQTVIKTIPRQGLTIPSTVPVQKVIKSNITTSSGKENIKDNNQPETTNIIIKKIFPTYLWAIIVVIPLVLTIILFLASKISDKRDYFSQYSYAGKIDNCSVYLYNKNTTLERYKQYLKKHQGSCAENSFVYFSTYPLVPRVSVIRCKQAFSTGLKNSCVSEYHLNWQHYE